MKATVIMYQNADVFASLNNASRYKVDCMISIDSLKYDNFPNLKARSFLGKPQQMFN